MSNETKQKPKGMYLKSLLERLGCGRTKFYTQYASLIPVHKDASGYKNIYLLEDIEKLEKHIAEEGEIEIIK